MSNSNKSNFAIKGVTARGNSGNRVSRYAQVPVPTYYANAKIFSKGASVKRPQKIGKLCKCILDD